MAARSRHFLLLSQNDRKLIGYSALRLAENASYCKFGKRDE